MSLVSGKIDPRDGAAIDVLVGVSKNRKARLLAVSLPVPSRVALRLQLDTGSSLTAFPSHVFQSLGITRFRTVPVSTPSTLPGKPHIADQYDVSLALVSGLNRYVIESIHAIAAEDFHPSVGVQGIIGRDVLQRCVFQYFGPHNRFEFGW
jgi:hypothetical protein